MNYKNNFLYESFDSFCSTSDLNIFSTEFKDGTYAGYIQGYKLYIQSKDKIEIHSLYTNIGIRGRKSIIVTVKNGKFKYNV